MEYKKKEKKKKRQLANKQIAGKMFTSRRTLRNRPTRSIYIIHKSRIELQMARKAHL